MAKTFIASKSWLRRLHQPLSLSVKSQPHKQHTCPSSRRVWFLPTHEPTLKKPKELEFCQRTDEINEI